MSEENLENKLSESLDEICTLISRSGDPVLIKEFLNCLLTKTETEEIARRWILVQELDMGTTQREIARKYNMSLCKITRGSRELKKDSSAFRKMLDLYKKVSAENGER